MTLTQIVSHPLDRLIGETLYCTFDLIYFLHKKLSPQKMLTPIQSLIWMDWDDQAVTINQTRSPKKLITMIQRLRTMQADVDSIIDRESLLIHCKKSIRLITGMTSIRNKLNNHIPVSLDECRIWNRFQHIPLPEYPDHGPIDRKKLDVFCKLESHLRNAMNIRIDWEAVNRNYPAVHSLTYSPN